MQVLYVVYEVEKGLESKVYESSDATIVRPVSVEKGRHLRAVVASNAGINPPYIAEKFTLTASAQQQSASMAFNEVSKLSEEARAKLGMRSEMFSALKKQAESDSSLKARDTVYVTVYRGEDGRGMPKAKGVFSYKPKAVDPMYDVQEFILLSDFSVYLETEKSKKVAAEVSGVSEATKKFLKDFKP